MCLQIDVHITPGTHASEDAGKFALPRGKFSADFSCYVICVCMVSIQESADNQLYTITHSYTLYNGVHVTNPALHFKGKNKNPVSLTKRCAVLKIHLPVL